MAPPRTVEGETLYLALDPPWDPRLQDPRDPPDPPWEGLWGRVACPGP